MNIDAIAVKQAVHLATPFSRSFIAFNALTLLSPLQAKADANYGFVALSVPSPNRPRYWREESGDDAPVNVFALADCSRRCTGAFLGQESATRKFAFCQRQELVSVRSQQRKIREECVDAVWRKWSRRNEWMVDFTEFGRIG